MSDHDEAPVPEPSTLTVAPDPMEPWDTVECESPLAADHWNPAIWR
ncbi:hypothetical protein [Rhodococcus sp. H29-C3]|nr:hypothetical protein [Rhodococcus sp. H29-C3]MDJ0361544.1 hypothetical protein [Rhodococcus sp. H29-C3]